MMLGARGGADDRARQQHYRHHFIARAAVQGVCERTTRPNCRAEHAAKAEHVPLGAGRDPVGHSHGRACRQPIRVAQLVPFGGIRPPPYLAAMAESQFVMGHFGCRAAGLLRTRRDSRKSGRGGADFAAIRVANRERCARHESRLAARHAGQRHAWMADRRRIGAGSWYCSESNRTMRMPMPNSGLPIRRFSFAF